MKKEIEVRLLNIDKQSWVDKLISNGFEFIGEYNQKRYIYDFNPINPNKWIRLRTNGEESTLTIKEIIDVNKADGVNEWEVKVNDFNEMASMMHELGFNYRNYQENVRMIFRKPGVEIVIDSWPLIPTYIEIETETNDLIESTLKELNIDEKDTTTLDVMSIYKNYGVDIKSIKELKF